MTAQIGENKVITQHSHFVESPFLWLEGTGQWVWLPLGVQKRVLHPAREPK